MNCLREPKRIYILTGPVLLHRRSAYRREPPNTQEVVGDCNCRPTAVRDKFAVNIEDANKRPRFLPF